MRTLTHRLMLMLTAAVLALLAVPATSAQAYQQGPVSWARDSFSTQAYAYGAGVTGTDPYEGGMYASVKSTQPNGSIYQDVNRAINPGDTFCASAMAVTEGTATGGGVTLALFLLGGTVENSHKAIGNLPNGNNWTPISSCVTATAAHGALRVQFYPTVNGPTIGVDAVNVHSTLNTDAGFNTGLGPWTARAGTNLINPGAGDPGGEPYEGTGYAAATASGSFYQLIAQNVHPGDTYCATGQFSSYASGGGSGGTIAIWLTGGTQENTTRAFNGLPGKNTWQKEQACVTATGSHTQIVLEVYPALNLPTLAVDDFEIHRSLAVNGGFNNGATDWLVRAPTAYTTYGPGLAGTDPYEGSQFAAALPAGSIGQDAATDAPTVCATAQVVSLGSAAGASVRAAIWDMSSSNPQLLTTRQADSLPGGNSWAPVTACASSYTGPGTRRFEYYILNGTLAIDAVDAAAGLVNNGGMNQILIN